MTSRGRALKHLKKVDPLFHKKTKHLHASLPTRLTEKSTKNALFHDLVSIVVSQQLGVKAADAIFARVKQACGGKIIPASVLKTRATSLSNAGLSGAKIKTIKEVAKAVKNRTLKLTELGKIPETEAAEKLTEIWGLGPWSAEMFMMFSLGRPDVFSTGDLGLVRAMEALYGLPKDVPRASLLRIAEKWSPYRTYACLLLWRSRDAVPLSAASGRHSAAARDTKAG